MVPPTHPLKLVLLKTSCPPEQLGPAQVNGAPHSDILAVKGFFCPIPHKVWGVWSRGYPCSQGEDYHQGVCEPLSRSSALSRNNALHNSAEAAVSRGVQVRKVTTPTQGHAIWLLPASTPAMVLGRSDAEGGPQPTGTPRVRGLVTTVLPHSERKRRLSGIPDPLQGQ